MRMPFPILNDSHVDKRQKLDNPAASESRQTSRIFAPYRVSGGSSVRIASGRDNLSLDRH